MHAEAIVKSLRPNLITRYLPNEALMQSVAWLLRRLAVSSGV